MCNLAIPDNEEFIAISADDKILAEMAALFGFRILSRDEDSCVLLINDEEVFFYVLGTQAFPSDKKTSRIVVKRRGSADIYMYLKGSKQAMQHIYKESFETEEIDRAIIEYRNLYLGYKLMSKKEVDNFMFEYSNARLSFVNKEGQVESVFEKYEKDAKFLGILGLEDSVTEETKLSITYLKNAGVKFWVLSGDSQESTEISALSSGIFDSESKILRIVNNTSELDCLNYLETYVKQHVFPTFADEKQIENEVVIKPFIRTAKSEEITDNANQDIRKIAERRSSFLPVKTRRRSSVHPFISRLSLYKHLTDLQGDFNPKLMNFVLSIDSKGFEYCMETQIHLKYFIVLLFTAKAVCFHSLFPDQKAKIIKLMRTNFRFSPLVLSVGDSISDIGMIQEAHIGVGIEGSSAARNADVTVKTFADLRNLLLIHGHRQYVQISKMILLSFYAMALLEFHLAFYNIISG